MTSFQGSRKSPSARSPYFIQDLKGSAVRSGGIASLECRVAGFPKPEIRWERRGGRMVAKSRYVHTERTGDRCILQIKFFQQKDADLYSCVATNNMGSATSTAQINVLSENDRSQRNTRRPPLLKVQANSSVRSVLSKKDVANHTSKQRDSSPNVRNQSFRCFSASPSRQRNSSNKQQVTSQVNGSKHETLSRAKDHMPVLKKMLHLPTLPKACLKPGRIQERPRVPSLSKIEKPNIERSDQRAPLQKPCPTNSKMGEGSLRSLEGTKKLSDKSTLRGRTGQRAGFAEKSIMLNSNATKIKENVSGISESKRSLSLGASTPKGPVAKDGIKSKPKDDLHPSERRKSIKLTRQNKILEDESCDGQLDHLKSEADFARQENDGIRKNGSPTIPPVSSNDQSPPVIVRSTKDKVVSVACFESNLTETITNQANQMLVDHRRTEVDDGQPNNSRQEQKVCGHVAGKTVKKEVLAEPCGVLSPNTIISEDPRISPCPRNVRTVDFYSSSVEGPASITEKVVSVDGSEKEGRPRLSEITTSLPLPKAKEEVEKEKNSSKLEPKDDKALGTRKSGSRRERESFEVKPCTGSLRFDNAVIEEECEFLVKSGVLREVEEDEAEEAPDMHHVVEASLEQPVRIVKGPQSVTVLRGESVTLACHFTGIPQPAVTWAKGGKTLTSDGRVSILVGRDMSVLTICDVTADDSGKYVVSVENCTGGDSCFASMAVVGIPEPPGGQPTASDVTDHSLVLSWYGSMYDGGSVVTGYVVEMCTLPGRHWYRISNCVNTSHVIQGLSQGQHYVFRVRAENRYGLSNPSRESEAVFLEDISASLEEWDSPPPPVQLEAGSRFSELFELKEEVGKGRFGTVYRCIEKTSGRPRAAKIIRCFKSKDKVKVQQEIDVMNRLHHPKLMQILAAFESGRNIIMVMEFISGGELFERVIADDFVLTEHDCILFMQQICDGVAYMHKSSILHLDLKPENILCKTRTSHQIKIIDFGLARVYNPEENLRVLFGTPEFVAPEVINYEPVLPASDMWSVGVVCYVLLSGLSPFMGDSDPETFANITRGEVDFDDDAFDTISEEAKDFISQLLIKRSKERMSAEECLKHLWLIDVKWETQDVPLSTEKLKKFIVRRKWQKTGTAIRALGRMVSLSRSSMGSSSCSSSPMESPTTMFRPPQFAISRSETSESGFSELSRDSSISELLS